MLWYYYWCCLDIAVTMVILGLCADFGDTRYCGSILNYKNPLWYLLIFLIACPFVNLVALLFIMFVVLHVIFKKV